MKLSDTTQEEWFKHVLAEYPREAVAFVVDGELFPVDNRAEDPERTFAVASVDRIRAEAAGKVEALLHSHPYTLAQSQQMQWPPEWPSEPDMRGWLADNIPWGISTTDGEGVNDPIWMDESEIAPLEGRPFVHGIWDCYSLVRDWFRVNKQVTLPNFARGMSWWYTEQDLYSENFRAAGFVEITAAEAVPGDCVLMRFFGDKISHAAVITGPNQIMHHAYSRNGQRLSGYDSLTKWSRQIVKYVRYQPQNDS